MGKHTAAPAPPNYAAAATAQGQANDQTALTNSQLSNPNIQTPYGTQTVTWGDNNQPNISQSLTPIGQQTVDQQQQTDLGLSTLANQQTGNVSNILNNPFSFGGTPQTSVTPNAYSYGRPDPQVFNNQGFNGYGSVQNSPDLSNVAAAPVNAGTTAQQAIMSRLQPELDRQRTSTETQLVNQGLRPGSEAYDNAIKDLGQQENDQRTQAALQGINLDMSANQQGYGQALGLQQANNAAQNQGFTQGQSNTGFNNSAMNQNLNNTLASNQFGNSLQQQQYNQALQSAQFGNTANQQSLAQQLQLRDQPLNEITALMSGSQVQNPQFAPFQGSSAQPAPVFGATQAQGAFDQNAYNQQVAQQNSALGGLFGLGGSILGGPLGGLIGKGIGSLF